MKYIIFKEICDRIIALFLLIFFIPIFLLISILIYFKMGSPVIFKQKRAGYKGNIFQIIKFRTMKKSVDINQEFANDSKRLTNLGIFLRNSSLDEIPALINIIKGDMSFVGPRPLLEEYLSLYSEEQLRRHNVKPGFTGWAQINGRNKISWKKKFKLDLWYVKKINFLLDLYIIFLTLYKVFQRKDISFPSEDIDNRFKGNPKKR